MVKLEIVTSPDLIENILSGREIDENNAIIFHQDNKKLQPNFRRKTEFMIDKNRRATAVWIRNEDLEQEESVGYILPILSFNLKIKNDSNDVEVSMI